MDFISLKSILADYSLIGKIEDETKLLQWAIDALDTVNTYRGYEQQLCVLDIDNYKAALPEGFVSVAQITASNNCINSKQRHSIAVLQEAVIGMCGECKLKVVCEDDCKSACPLIYSNNYLVERTLPWIGYNRVVETSQDYSNKNMTYTLVPCLENTNNYCYTISDKTITVNFKTGQILLSYLSKKTDEDGLPMIPNVVQVIQAILAYIEERLAWIDYRVDKNYQNKAFWELAQNNKQLAIAKAININLMPTPDEMEIITSNLNKLIPNAKYRYYTRSSTR